MPRETLFTREEIIEAAFNIFAAEGMTTISARKVAASLGCSTAPVYTSFSSMDELKGLLLDKALELLSDYTQRMYTPHVFLNMGVGMLEFAKDYPLVYRTLFLEGNTYQFILSEFMRRNLIQMKKDPALRVFDEPELQSILDKLTAYTHGLAAFICADMLEHQTTAHFIDSLQDAGGDIMVATALKQDKFEEFMRGEDCVEEDNNH